MTATRVAVVRYPGQAAAEARRIEAALRTERHQVSRMSLAQASAALEGAPAPVAVVTSHGCMAHDEWSSVMRVAEDGGIPVVIALDSDDPATARSIFSGRAAPWVPDGPFDLPAIRPWVDPCSAAVEAVRAHLSGKHARAYAGLHAVARSSEPDEALEALIQLGALTLERFRERAAHPVPSDVLAAHLVDQTGELTGAAHSWWWTMTEHMVFRSAGVTLPPVDPASRTAEVLSGAFHAASTIVRFTARRQWRLPRDLFDDLVLGTPEAAQDGTCTPARSPVSCALPTASG